MDDVHFNDSLNLLCLFYQVNIVTNTDALDIVNDNQQYRGEQVHINKMHYYFLCQRQSAI